MGTRGPVLGPAQPRSGKRLGPSGSARSKTSLRSGASVCADENPDGIIKSWVFGAYGHGPRCGITTQPNQFPLDILFFRGPFPGNPKFRPCLPIPSSCASRAQGQPGGLLRLSELQDPHERCLLVSGRLRRRSPAAAQQRRGQGALQRASELPPPPPCGQQHAAPAARARSAVARGCGRGRAPLAPIATV